MKTQPTPIASAAALALMSMALSAQAQQAAPAPAAAASAAATGDDVQTVTVTGIRASLQQSLTQKRNAESHVEVVTAEDVGKMPDKNVADSLQHLPGVFTATAGGTEGGFGENDRVSLRGAPSALTLTTLNGHTISSGDWYSQNITSGGRSVSYSLLPSELISRVTVHKSSQADLVEGGAAGSVDIETRKPLEFGKLLSAFASLEALHTTLAGKTDPQVSALVNWKNDEGSFGVMLQGFYEKQHLRRDGQEFLWWDTVNDLWGKNTDVLAAHPDLDGKAISGLTGSALFEQERVRQGGLVDFEFKPSQALTLDLSAFYSRLSAVNTNDNYMFDPFSPIVNGISPSSYTISGNTVTALTFPGTCPLAGGCAAASSSVEDIAVRPGAHSDSQFVNLDVKFVASDKLRFTGKLGQTEGTGQTKDIGFEVWSPYVGGSYTTHGLGSPADVSVPGSGTFSIGGSSSAIGGWASDVTAKDKETYGQIDGVYATPMDTLPNLRFGLRAAEHKRDLTNVPGTLDAAGTDPANAPLSDVTNYPANYGDSLGGGVLTGAWTIPGSAITDWANQHMTFSGHTYQSEFSIKEPVSAAYVMADLDAGAVTGNFGLRVVNTKEKVTNNALVSGGVYTPVTVDNSYTDVLPSLNLRTDLAKNLVGRFALSRTMARPDFGQLGGLSLLDVQQTGTGGNPNLKPILSNNVDLDAEWYFAPKSMLAAGVYYMDLRSYVTYGSFDATFYNQSQKAYTTYHMSAPANTTGQLKGIELSYEQALAAGFGVQANYTYATGKETGHVENSACTTTGNCDLVGTSKNSYNIGGFFENDSFSARVTYNYRSSFLNGLDRKSAIYQDGVGVVNASLAYNINKQITLSLEGRNLNDPLLKSYATTPDQPRAFYKNGREIYFGIRASL
jgi:iron complex outermembrane receptor protein